MAAAAARLGERRRARWATAFRAPTPDAAIKQSWALLVSEAKNGTIRAWTALCAQGHKVTDQAVNSEAAAFNAALVAAAEGLLKELGLQPTVPLEELGLLLAGVVHGMGLELQAGIPPPRLEGAYAAAWLGVLSLTRPAPP